MSQVGLNIGDLDLDIQGQHGLETYKRKIFHKKFLVNLGKGDT